ncbi:hypothetical protein [Sphingomonas sp. 22176]|uniref:hypothetical protein n=1 Tax=Sphingomonas sp. 22176 TaxID=3453884 RepID=UPI003F85F827
MLERAEAFRDATFVRNARSGMVALRTRADSWMGDNGEPILRVELQRPSRREFMREADLFESAWEPIDRDTFVARWQAEVEEAAEKLDVETIRLATGLLLPIWSALPRDHLAVHRVVDKGGNSWLGRLVFDQHVVDLFTKLGISKTEDMPARSIIDAALSGRPIEIKQPFPMTIRRASVNGNERIEIEGAPAGQLPWFKSLGCWTELISYKTRLFIPATEQASSILARILE